MKITLHLRIKTSCFYLFLSFIPKIWRSHECTTITNTQFLCCLNCCHNLRVDIQAIFEANFNHFTDFDPSLVLSHLFRLLVDGVCDLLYAFHGCTEEGFISSVYQKIIFPGNYSSGKQVVKYKLDFWVRACRFLICLNPSPLKITSFPNQLPIYARIRRYQTGINNGEHLWRSILGSWIFFLGQKVFFWSFWRGESLGILKTGRPRPEK